VWSHLNYSISQHYESGWISFFDTFKNELPEAVAPLSGLIRAVSSGGWIFPFDNMVVCTNRPSELHRDDRNRLHNANGPALLYRDGWSIHAWHGTRVPDWCIEQPDMITVAKIQAETNQEVRRAMIEAIGGERFVDELGAECVGVDDYGALYAKEVDGAKIAYARLINSTPEPDGSSKIYWLRVDPQSKSCHEAVGRSFLGDRWKEYRPIVQT
jgi:hypothetical protein